MPKNTCCFDQGWFSLRGNNFLIVLFVQTGQAGTVDSSVGWRTNKKHQLENHSRLRPKARSRFPVILSVVRNKDLK